MNGDTNVQVVGFAAALTTLLIWVLGYYLPELVNSAPTGLEAAITTIIAVLAGVFTKGDAGTNLLPGKGRSDSPLPIGIIGLMLTAVLMSSGCAGTRSAYQQADGLYETSQVMGEHYLALVRQLNNMANSSALAGDELDAAQALVREATPAVTAMGAAATAYKAVRSATNKIELSAAVNQAAIAIARILEVVKARRAELGRSSLVLPMPYDYSMSNAALTGEM